MSDEPKTTKEIVEAWIKLQRAPRESKFHDQLFWSHVVFEKLIRTDPGKALGLILDILQTDSSDKVLENLSAGPLEDLLVDHGNLVIGKIEAEAARNPTFRRLLGGVWKRSMADNVWRQVQRCADRSGWDGSVLGA